MENNYLHVYRFFEFAVEWIPAVRNKAEIIFTRITAIADKKLISLLCVSGHSHKKLKDSVEGSLDRVLFAAELAFPKILVPRLPQNSSDVNMERAGKSKQLYSLFD